MHCGVGIIGASAEGGWARDGHVPAVQALDGLEFVAFATNSQRTADASAPAFGVPAVYRSGMDLIRAPGIDLVTVATRVPDHRELVLAAIAAGKHDYSEWPLGCGVAGPGRWWRQRMPRASTPPSACNCVAALSSSGRAS